MVRNSDDVLDFFPIIFIGIIADLTDYDQLKSDQRREAMYYGIYGIVRKTGRALCSLMLAGVFSAFGYSTENPHGVRLIPDFWQH